MKRKIAAPIALALALIACLSACLAEASTDALAYTVTESGFNDSYNGKRESGYVFYVMDLTLSNWSMETYTLNDAIIGKMTCANGYVIEGEAKYDAETIDPFVELGGTIGFKVPEVVADGKAGDLILTLTIAGAEHTETVVSSTVQQDPAADAGVQTAEGMTIETKKVLLYDTWEGEEDPGYRWIVVEFSLDNLSPQPFEPKSSTLQLSYQGAFTFDGEVTLNEDSIKPFMSGSGRAVFKVPNLVAEAGEGDLTLNTNVNGQAQTLAIAPGTMVKATPTPEPTATPKPTSKPEKTVYVSISEYEAKNIAETMLRSMLKNPQSLQIHSSTASLDRSDGSYTVMIDYSAMNGFGGLNRETFLCGVNASTGAVIYADSF